MPEAGEFGWIRSNRTSGHSNDVRKKPGPGQGWGLTGSLTALLGIGPLTVTQRRTLYVAFGTSLANVMGSNLIYPVLPVVAREFQVSEAQVGLLVSAFAAPAIVLAPLFGTAADFWGRRRVLIPGLTLFGLAGAAAAFAPSFSWLVALRALQGVGMSAISPLSIVLIGDLLEGARETSGQGLKVVLDRVGLILFPLLGGLLAQRSWSATFLLYALVLPLVAVAYRHLPETARSGRLQFRPYLQSMVGAVRQPRLEVAFGAGFLRFFLDYGLFTYFPLLLALGAGGSAAAASSGLLLGLYAAGAIVTASQAGRLVEGRNPARPLAAAFLIDGAVLALLPALPVGYWAPLLLVYGMANGLLSPLQKSLLTRNAPVDLRGGVISVDRLVQQVAKSLSPVLLGFVVLLAGLRAVFLALAALSVASVVAGALATALRRAERRVPA